MYNSTTECLYQESKKAEVHGNIRPLYMVVLDNKHLTHQVMSSLLTAVVVVVKEKQLDAEEAVPPKSPLQVAVDADEKWAEPEEREPNVVGIADALQVEPTQAAKHLLHPHPLSFQVVPPSHPPPQPVCCQAVYNQHKNMRSIIVITLLV